MLGWEALCRNYRLDALAATTDEHGMVDIGTLEVKPGRAPTGKTVMHCSLVISGQASQADLF